MPHSFPFPVQSSPLDVYQLSHVPRSHPPSLLRAVSCQLQRLNTQTARHSPLSLGVIPSMSKRSVLQTRTLIFLYAMAAKRLALQDDAARPRRYIWAVQRLQLPDTDPWVMNLRL